MRWANWATIGIAAVLVAASVAYNHYDIKDMIELQIQVDLRLYGEGIYEYHALTGKWPSRIDDLARTSLPQRYPRWWIAQLEVEPHPIACTKNLKPNPQDNAHLILVYHDKGLDAERGRIWVCWGDLRTGYITAEELQAILKKQKN